MLRRFLGILLCLMLVCASASADLLDYPTRSVFSLGYNRLYEALDHEKPALWRVTITPAAMEGLSEQAISAMSMIMSATELRGSLQRFVGGGYANAAVFTDGQQIAYIEQAIENGRTGLNLAGDWYSIQVGMESEGSAMLGLGEVGELLLSMDYESLSRGDTPFFSDVYDLGIDLWCLASPYGTDNHNLSVPSGSTSHGTSFEIDTNALRSMLTQWTDGLSLRNLTLGMGGAGISFGISKESFSAFVEKAGRYAEVVELAKPIKMNMTFGEGDVLRTVRASGTLQEDGRRTGISLSYTADVSSTRISRKYNIDLQPRDWDTLKATCTWINSSNNKNKSEESFALNASGTYEGETYRIRIDQKMTNQYAMDELQQLTENITGTIAASLTYAGETVVDISARRTGQTVSSRVVDSAVFVWETYDVKLQNAGGILFEGEIALEYVVEQGRGEQSPIDILYEAQHIEDIGMTAAESIRQSMQAAIQQMRNAFIQALPSHAVAALLQAY